MYYTFVWDYWNKEHIKKHNVTADEAEEICRNSSVQQQTYNGRKMFFGETEKKGSIMNRPKPIKPFKTLADEAAFWDTHDVTRIFEQKNTKLTDLPDLEKEKETAITIRLQKSIKNKLETIARARGINPSTLSRMWIIEKLYKQEA